MRTWRQESFITDKKCVNRIQNGAERPTAILTHCPHFVLDFLLSLFFIFCSKLKFRYRTKICYCLFTQGPNLGRMGRLDLSLLSTVEGCAEVKNVNRWTPDPRTASKLCKRLAILKCGVVSVWSSQFLSQCGSFMFLFTFFYFNERLPSWKLFTIMDFDGDEQISVQSSM